MNKKFTYLAAMAIAFGMTACGGQKKQEAEERVYLLCKGEGRVTRL